MPVEKSLSVLSFTAAVPRQNADQQRRQKDRNSLKHIFSAKFEPAQTHKYSVRVKFQFPKVAAKKRRPNDYPKKWTNMRRTRSYIRPDSLFRGAFRQDLEASAPTMLCKYGDRADDGVDPRINTEMNDGTRQGRRLRRRC
jgi:hypothetical protein